MAFRFRRSIRIAPGIRLNAGKRGMSVSVGGRGATMTFGPRGTYSNFGIPGTGLSWRSRLDGGQASLRRIEAERRREQRENERLERLRHRQEALAGVTFKLTDNGALEVTDAFGAALSRTDLKLAWEQKGDAIRDWLKENLEEINGDVDLLLRVHEDTPSLDEEPVYDVQEFEEAPPAAPEKPILPPEPTLRLVKPPNAIMQLFPGVRRRFEERTAQALHEHEKAIAERNRAIDEARRQYGAATENWKQAMAEWGAGKSAHEADQEQLAVAFYRGLREDVDAMSDILERAFDSLSWPRETSISYEIKDTGKEVWLDVDLPEIEDLPQRVAEMSANERKLNIKDKSQKQLRQEYATHVHGIGFRLIGTVFATLPAAQMIAISGYSQRLDKATGKVNDDYLYSVRVSRESFREIDFSALEHVDPIAALGAFDIRRKMTATGIFKPIEPFESMM